MESPLTRQEFEKRLQSLADQSAMLQRLVRSKNLDHLLQLIELESQRLTGQSKKLEFEAKLSGIII